MVAEVAREVVREVVREGSASGRRLARCSFLHENCWRHLVAPGSTWQHLAAPGRTPLGGDFVADFSRKRVSPHGFGTKTASTKS